MLKTRTSKPFGRTVIPSEWNDIRRSLGRYTDERIAKRLEVGYAAKVRDCSGRVQYSFVDGTPCRNESAQEIVVAGRSDGLTFPLDVDPGKGRISRGSTTTSAAFGDTSLRLGKVLVAVTPEGESVAFSGTTGDYLGTWSEVVKPVLKAMIAAGFPYEGPTDAYGEPTEIESETQTVIEWIRTGESVQWYPRIMHQLGGWSFLPTDLAQGQGIVRLAKSWPSFALGLGPSTGYAMGSLALSTSAWDETYPYVLLGLSSYDVTMSGGTEADPPIGVIPASLYDARMTGEKIVLWRVDEVGVFGDDGNGNQTWSTRPSATIIHVQDPPRAIPATYPEAQHSWIANADGSWYMHEVGTGRERELTRYTLPSSTGPVRPLRVDSVTPMPGGVAGFGLSYCYTWVDGDGNESLPSPAAIITYDGARTESSIALSGILAGPDGTEARRVYRGATFDPYNAPRFDQMQLVSEISDNMTETLTDDAGASDPSVSPPGPSADEAALTLDGGPDITYVFYAPEYEDFTAEQVNMALTFQAFGGINRKILAWLKAFRPEVFED